MLKKLLFSLVLFSSLFFTPNSIQQAQALTPEEKRERFQKKNAWLKTNQEELKGMLAEYKARRKARIIKRKDNPPLQHYNSSWRPLWPKEDTSYLKETKRQTAIRTGKLDPGETYPRGIIKFECGPNCPSEFTKEYIEKIEDTYDRQVYLFERRIGIPLEPKKTFIVYPRSHPTCAANLQNFPTSLGATGTIGDITYICVTPPSDFTLTDRVALQTIMHEYAHYYLPYNDPENPSIEGVHRIIEEMTFMIGENLKSYGRVCRFRGRLYHGDYRYLRNFCELGFDIYKVKDLILEVRKYQKEVGHTHLNAKEYATVFTRLTGEDADWAFVELPDDSEKR